MAFLEAKTWNVNRQAVYYATNGVADIPSTGDFFNVGDWIVNINPTMAVGDVLAWVCSAVSGNTPTFTAQTYVGAVKGVTTLIASTTVSTTAGTVLANATSAGFTVTMPTMGTSAGQAYGGYNITIFKTDSSANPVTIVPVGTSTLDGAASLVLYSQYESADYRSSGAANGTWYRSDSPGNVYGLRSAAASQTLSTSDQIFISSSAGTLTLPAATAWPVGQVLCIHNVGVNTITPVSGNINGAASVTSTAHSAIQATSDGTNWYQIG
jgi:hypothetical protein